MGQINKGAYQLNRKVLADLAMNEPQAFAAIVKEVMGAK
jgi:large subunit ribosomal protein L20